MMKSRTLRTLCGPRPGRLLPALLALLILVLGPGAARAQLTFTLSPTSLAGLPGSTLTFSGTLTNTGASELFLNSDNFTLAGTGLSLNDDLFFDNVPVSLLAGQSFKGSLFQVVLDKDVVPGDYAGSFTIVGGADLDAQDDLATANFQATATPEPGTAALLLVGGVALGGAAFNRAGRARRRA